MDVGADELKLEFKTEQGVNTLSQLSEGGKDESEMP